MRIVSQIFQNIGVVPIILDVREADTVTQAVNTITEWTKTNQQPFVALINNAGISFSMPVEFVPLDKARNLFEINFFGLLHVTQSFLPLIRAHKGRIISVGSVAGLVAAPGHGTYSASKHAVEVNFIMPLLPLLPQLPPPSFHC